jgi:hypothetical protein
MEAILCDVRQNVSIMLDVDEAIVTSSLSLCDNVAMEAILCDVRQNVPIMLDVDGTIVASSLRYTLPMFRVT